MKSVTRINSRRKVKSFKKFVTSRNLLEMNCIYWFVEFVSYFASSNNDSELVESIICPSKVVFSIIHLLFPDTDGHWTQSIINSKVVLVVYMSRTKFLKNLFLVLFNCHIIFFFVFIYNVTLTNTISSLYMLYSLNNKIYVTT